MPSLRNVALRQTFFHNGAFNRLEDVVRFYVLRDLKPEEFFPRKADGSADVFNDLPPQYRGNINTDPPFRTPSGAAALTDAEIADVVHFLKTLTDNYRFP